MSTENHPMPKEQNNDEAHDTFWNPNLAGTNSMTDEDVVKETGDKDQELLLFTPTGRGEEEKTSRSEEDVIYKDNYTPPSVLSPETAPNASDEDETSRTHNPIELDDTKITMSAIDKLRVFFKNRHGKPSQKESTVVEKK
ncbi:MAG: hypothetical protein ABH832_02380 [bacterium]